MFLLRVEESIRIRNFIQIDTTNILFICGGAFDGLEKIIEARQDTKSIGFRRRGFCPRRNRNVGELLKEVMPEDFIKYRTDSGVYRTCAGSGNLRWTG